MDLTNMLHVMRRHACIGEDHGDEVIEITRLLGRMGDERLPVEIGEPRRYMAAGCTYIAVGLDSGLLARSSEALAKKFTGYAG